MHAPQVTVVLNLKLAHRSPEDSNCLLKWGREGEICLRCLHALLGILLNGQSPICIIFFFSIALEKCGLAVLSRKGSAS